MGKPKHTLKSHDGFFFFHDALLGLHIRLIQIIKDRIANDNELRQSEDQFNGDIDR